MRKLLTILFLFVSCFVFAQTNATFNNLDVRNTSKFRGLIYPFGASARTPVDPADEILMVDVGDFKMVRVDFQEFADSILVSMSQLWYLDGDTIINLNDYKVRMTDEVYIYPLPPEATKTGRMMHINQYGQVEWMSPATLVDTLQILMPPPDSVLYADTAGYAPQYWTFIDSATDTLKNNVSTAGVVAVKGNLELQTTNAAATNGVVKQNGVNLIHTYHEKGDNNLFIGQGAGNFTQDSSFNIGIGKLAISSLTTGYNNIGIGYNTLKDATGPEGNTAIGALSMVNIKAVGRNTAVGYQTLYYLNNTASPSNTANNAFGYQALRMSTTASSNTGYSNCALGTQSMYLTTSGFQNTGVGNLTLYNTTIGTNNTGVGYNSLRDNTEGISNTAVGSGSLFANKDNDGSTAIGYNSMYYADNRATGEQITYNTAIGYEAMRGSTTAANNTGQYNTATGYQALDGMTSGSFNTVYGYDAGGGITTGDSNILIGTSAGSQLTTESDQLYIDNTNTTTPLIYGNFRTDALTFNGDITYGDTFWDDLSTPATQARIGVTNTPAFNYDTLALLWDNTPVDTSTQYIVLTYQLPHRWKAGSNLHLHVHYLQHSASDTCEFFKATYKWTDMGETRAGAYTTTKTTNQTVYAYSSNTLHQLASFPAISGAGHTESSILQIVLYCYSDANLYSLDTDIHFEIDKPGSDAEFP